MTDLLAAAVKRFRFFFFVLCVFTAGHVSGQEKGYYRFPLDEPPLLSANFAEVRANHLHSGLDIKTGGVEGKAVRAAADGYICRIGIKPYGFGRVLYVAHPNGTTTVYAHLSRFTGPVEDWVRQMRYKNRQHGIDLFPQAGQFPVNSGEIIARSGNSGASGGPHLHFEIRGTESQRTINPVPRGFVTTKDNIAPTIVSVIFYPVDTVAGVPYRGKPVKSAAVRRSPGRYDLGGTLTLPGKGYFVLEVTDRKNDTHNTMGVYRITGRADGQVFFDASFDELAFDQTRYVNSLSEYPLQTGSRNELIRLARQDNNRLDCYRTVSGRGIVNPASCSRIEIDALDDSGNRSTVTFGVRSAAGPSAPSVTVPSCAEIVDWRREARVTTGPLTVTIPARTLYESLFYVQKPVEGPVSFGQNGPSVPVLSDLYTVHCDTVPLHGQITVSFSVDIAPQLRERAMLGRRLPSGKLVSAGGKYSGGAVTGRTARFGDYCVVADTVAPFVRPSFAGGADLSGKTEASFTIGDNFSGVAAFEGYIDDKWIIFEQDTRTGKITHVFDDRLIERGREHRMEIRLTDGAGNRSVFRTTFYR